MKAQPKHRSSLLKMSALGAVVVLSSRKYSLPLARGFALNSRSPSHYFFRNVMNLDKTPIVSLRMTSTETNKDDLELKIKIKGDEIRAAKDSGADKETVAPLVAELLALKAQLDPSSVPQKNKKNEKKQPQASTVVEEQSDFITPRAENYSKWYNDIIRVTGLAESSPVRGCMVIKPWGMSIWENIRDDLDKRIKAHGAENAYFPLLIPKSFLSKEAEHVDGFAKECAVVTHHRLCADPSGEKGLIADPEAELEEPLIIRPTSETIIWNMFKKWIVSHR
jgi:prolyl-tRNA synthetase